MSKRNSRLCVAAICAFLAASALAQNAKGYDDQRAELDAQIDLLRKKKELEEALRAVAGVGAASMPSVVLIMGIEGRYTARLIQPNGVVGYFGEGDVVRPGVTVAAITPRAVAVKVGEGKKARTVPLEFMAGATTPGMPGMPGMPGLPPGAPAGALPPELLPAPPSVMPRLPSPTPAAQAAPAMPPAAPVASAQPSGPGAAPAPKPAAAPVPAR